MTVPTSANLVPTNFAEVGRSASIYIQSAKYHSSQPPQPLLEIIRNKIIGYIGSGQTLGGWEVGTGVCKSLGTLRKTPANLWPNLGVEVGLVPTSEVQP